LKKFCVFCGKKPDSKNKEHIISQWLIKMTGDPNRQINLGFDTRHYDETGESRIRTFSFKSFQFPACKKCNTEFSELEAVVKRYFERIFQKDYFFNTEIDQLLDWFDKVRVGLWLGSISLDNFVDLVEPKYHIKNRISHRDRCLFIYELEESKETGIQFIGFNSPGFQFIPSCFSLRVNNIYFFNYSFDFLFAKNIGFPYPKSVKYDDDSRYMQIEFAKGLSKIHLPLINQKFLKASNYIYQPIIPTELMDSDVGNIYKTDKYIKDNCFDFERGKGDIFYFENGIKKIDGETELQLYAGTQNYNLDTFPNQMAKQTFQTLEGLLKLKPHNQIDNETKRKAIEQNRLTILKAHRDFYAQL
jgi:hypothetical protein